MQPVAVVAAAPSVSPPMANGGSPPSEQAHVHTVSAVATAQSAPSSVAGGGSPLPVSYGSPLVATPHFPDFSSNSFYQWYTFNIVLLTDRQFRAAECDYHAGRISLEELRRVRKELYGS